MRRYLAVLTILALLCAPRLISAQDVSDTQVLSQSQVSTPTYRTTSLPAEETIPGDLYIAGEAVTIAGTVLGDLYVAGGQVDLTGDVSGDVIVAGGQLNLGGTIDGSLRGIGGQVFVSSTIGKNMSLGGGTLIIDSSTMLSGNFTAVSGTVRLDAPLPGSATVLAGTMSILKPIQGNLTYITDPKNPPADEDLISGEVTRHEIKQPQSQSMTAKPDMQTAKAFLSILSIIHLASQLVVGLLLIYVLPKFMLKSADKVRTQTAKSVGVGFISIVVLPFVAIFLAMTLIGIPLGIMTLVAYGMLIYVGQFVAQYAVGTALTAKLGKKWGDSAVYATGLVILTLVSSIPLFGWIAGIIASFAGIGALVMTKKEILVTLREKKIL